MNDVSRRREFFGKDKDLSEFLKDSDKFLNVDEYIEKHLKDLKNRSYRPSDEQLKDFYRFYLGGGNSLIEWLLDITVRLPYPNVGMSLETAALAAARHEARCGIGEALVTALLQGKRLLEEEEK